MRQREIREEDIIIAKIGTVEVSSSGDGELTMCEDHTLRYICRALHAIPEAKSGQNEMKKNRQGI